MQQSITLSSVPQITSRGGNQKLHCKRFIIAAKYKINHCQTPQPNANYVVFHNAEFHNLFGARSGGSSTGSMIISGSFCTSFAFMPSSKNLSIDTSSDNPLRRLVLIRSSRARC
mmetsp:Transcript_5060/g.7323  ORF Transcript_5060/g.7323 Transcript_5060/m.7323 type:complete len:114 (+) Transcript_5060:92-433(+)